MSLESLPAAIPERSMATLDSPREYIPGGSAEVPMFRTPGKPLMLYSKIVLRMARLVNEGLISRDLCTF